MLARARVEDRTEPSLDDIDEDLPTVLSQPRVIAARLAPGTPTETRAPEPVRPRSPSDPTLPHAPAPKARALEDAAPRALTPPPPDAATSAPPPSVLFGPPKSAPSFAGYESNPPMPVAPIAVLGRPREPFPAAPPPMGPVASAPPPPAPSLAPAVVSSAPPVPLASGPRASLVVLALVVAFFGGMGTTFGLEVLAQEPPLAPRAARVLGTKATSLTLDGAVAAKEIAAEAPPRRRHKRKRRSPARVVAPADAAAREDVAPEPDALLSKGLGDSTAE